jgi:hypothetical protein
VVKPPLGLLGRSELGPALSADPFRHAALRESEPSGQYACGDRTAFIFGSCRG